LIASLQDAAPSGAGGTRASPFAMTLPALRASSLCAFRGYRAAIGAVRPSEAAQLSLKLAQLGNRLYGRRPLVRKHVENPCVRILGVKLLP
jgi:hypothetical protein